MKKLVMLIIGMALFTAGYQHTRRQSEYAAAQTVNLKAENLSSTVPLNIQHTFAFRLVKPS